MQVSPSQHMHIGDSILADIQCPQNMGIHTSHFEEKHNDLLKEQLADNFIHRKEGIMDAYLSEIDIGESLKISTKKRLFTEGWNYSSRYMIRLRRLGYGISNFRIQSCLRSAEWLHLLRHYTDLILRKLSVYGLNITTSL